MKHSIYFLICLIFFSAASVFAQTEKGIELYRNGDFDGATKILENAVTANKKDRKAWTYLGACYFKKGSKKEATKAFQKADSISVSKEELKEVNDGLVIKEKPRPSYTDAARQNGTQGEVKFAIEFGKDGKLNFGYLVQGLPNGLTENCIEAARKIKFGPGQKNGQPVTVVAIITYSFTIY